MTESAEARREPDRLQQARVYLWRRHYAQLRAEMMALGYTPAPWADWWYAPPRPIEIEIDEAAIREAEGLDLVGLTEQAARAKIIQQQEAAEAEWLYHLPYIAQLAPDEMPPRPAAWPPAVPSSQAEAPEEQRYEVKMKMRFGP